MSPFLFYFVCINEKALAMKSLNLVFTVLFLSILSVSFGQDIILLANRAKIEAKDIVVKNKTIYYQDFNESSGEIFTVPVNRIEYIQYASGEKVTPNDLLARVNSYNGLGNNLINFHLLDFATSNFTMSYERVISDGKFSIQIPVSFGYGDDYGNFWLPTPWDSEINIDFANRFSTGVALNIFPTRQGKVRYFFGPAIYGGSGVYYPGYDYYNESFDVRTSFVSFVVNNGLIISPISHFSLSLVGSLGARQLFDVEDGKTITTVKLAFNLSYRF